MTKVRKSMVVFFLIIAFAACSFLPTAVHGNNTKLKTYILYDSTTRFGSDFPLVTALIEYLQHFELKCEPMSLDNWHPGALHDAELIVYVGLKAKVLPQELLEEMAHAQRIIWFERNIEQMAACLKWQDFNLDEVSSGWTYIHEKEDKLFSDWLNVVLAIPGQKAQIFATVKNIADSRPLAWRRDNVYFCGLLDSDPSYMITLASLLHKFIPNNHSNSHNILLRIEDVSPLVDPKAVSAVISAINKYRIPFSIGVIPIGVIGSGNLIYIHERPELMNLLKEAQDNGASIIMHGYTHQNNYSPKTGEGYEFWNARDDKPMENDEAFTRERIEAGITELIRCGLIPFAFEPPHYAMSEAGSKVLSRYFNVFSGQVQISDKSARISLTLPYMAESAYLNGMIIIPENMGYYDGKSYRVEHMLQNSQEILDIQDGFAGFFYHGYLPPDKLPEIIEGVKKQGYNFFDLRQLPIRVQTPHIKIIGQDGQINVEVDEQLKASWGNTQVANNIIEKVGLVHVIVLLLIIGVFIFIIIHLRFNANKHYEQ